jgi:uncharacterized membrane protein (DUF106 family)
MLFEDYVLVVAIAAVFYSLIARFIQNKLVNRAELKAIQDESKRLSAEYKEAQKSGNQARIDAALKKQMEFFPKMNKIMFSQFKPMIVILMIFFAFNWAISTFDPTLKDDALFNLSDDGSGCDLAAADGVYSGCFSLSGSDYGKWVVTAKAYEGTSEIGSNSTYFLYNIDNSSDTFLEAPKGEMIEVSTEKNVYYPGDQLKVSARPPSRASSVSATLNMGTSFYVDLPFTIPILNVQRLQQPYWWFIFVALISGILVSVIYGRLQKAGIMK